MHVAIQAIASPQSDVTASAGPDMDLAPMGGAGGSAVGPGRVEAGTGGSMAGVSTSASTAATGAPNSTFHSMTNATASEKGAASGLNAMGQLNSNGHGVFGLQGIELTAATAGAQLTAVITSTSKDVHLDSGTQLLLVTQAATPAEAPKS